MIRFEESPNYSTMTNRHPEESKTRYFPVVFGGIRRIRLPVEASYPQAWSRIGGSDSMVCRVEEGTKLDQRQRIE